MDMRYLYRIVVVDKKTDEILIDTKKAAGSEPEAILKAASGKAIDYKKVDVVVSQLATLSKEPEKVHIEKDD